MQQTEKDSCQLDLRVDFPKLYFNVVIKITSIRQQFYRKHCE